MHKLSAFALATLAAGCIHVHVVEAKETVRGDGNVVSEQRPLPPFTQVRLKLGLDVEVTEGPAQAVTVTVDQNLQRVVETRVEGDTLVIDSSATLGGWGVARGRKVTIAVPELRGFAIRGSGDVRIAGADRPRDVALAIDGSGNLRWEGKARELAMAIRGSGDALLAGTAERLQVAISGSGDVKAQGLSARDASLAIDGSGDIVATLAGGSLSAAVSGSGDIAWYGQAQVQSSAVRGSGSIVHR